MSKASELVRQRVASRLTGTQINSHPNEPRRLEMPEVRAWIAEGVRRANEALSADHGIARAEFVIGDSHYPEIYRALAEKIVRIAHSSPQPSGGRDRLMSVFLLLRGEPI